jgi:NAD(P)-dependent dehydrogenase (short-subunit alcohol dehydrogenase family)
MSNNPFSLQGRYALVTGGSRGIGLGIARQLIALGASVVITGRDEPVLAAVGAELGDSCHYRVSDIDDCDAHAALVDEVESSLGPIDILVNNAGRHCKKPSLETTDDEMRAVLETNLVSLFSLTRQCLQRMMDRGRGSIINISSMSALYGLPQVAAYSSSKSALLGLTRTLASECSGSGVRINAIAPGFIESKMFLDIMAQDPAREARILQRTPMNRFGQPEDVAHAAAFLASDAASFITGVCLPVDGGNAIGF